MLLNEKISNTYDAQITYKAYAPQRALQILSRYAYPLCRFQEQSTVSKPSNTVWEKFYTVVNKSVHKDCDYFIDAGNCGAAAVHYLSVPHAATFYVNLGMGGMGYAIGAGLGAAAASHKRTLIFTGDGSFFMHGLELQTAVQHGWPVTIILFNNNSHGMCYARDLHFSADHPQDAERHSFLPTQWGQGLGELFPQIKSFTVNGRDDFAKVLPQTLGRKGVFFIEILLPLNSPPPFNF